MKRIFLIFIIFLAFFLRFYRLGDYPALNADEAAIGYNAYSLIQTGKDEHGNAWPIHFQSFNDYKPGLYFYLVTPLVKFFGLNEWTVRIPGATLGVLTVVIVYFLAKELFPNAPKFPILNFRRKNSYLLSIGEVAALFLAISPWHLHFSRGGWEVNASTFFITMGVWLFLKALKNPKLFIFSFLLFILSLYTYHAARVIVPFLAFGLLIFYRKEIGKSIKPVIVAAIFGVILLLPLLKDMFGPAGISRASGVGLFADPGPINRINEQRGEHANLSSLSAKIIHNKPVNYSLAFLDNWSEHFWGEFLFLTGDSIQRDKVPETGQMYLFDILLLFVGFYAFAKKSDKGAKLILWWLVIAPVAAALTFQCPHALRSHNMVIPLIIISALGFVTLISWIRNISKNKSVCTLLYFLLVTLVVWNFARYEHMYWIHMAKEYPYSSQYGVKELVAFVSENQDKYKNIFVTGRYDQPYILFLFYMEYPPDKFQADHILTAKDKFGFSTVFGFDKYQFGNIDFNTVKSKNPNSLIIGTSEEIPKGENIIKRIKGTNGFEYFDIVTN